MVSFAYIQQSDISTGPLHLCQHTTLGCPGNSKVGFGLIYWVAQPRIIPSLVKPRDDGFVVEQIIWAQFSVMFDVCTETCGDTERV